MITWFKSKSTGKVLSCGHKATDLTHGKGEVRNYYCVRCNLHFYNGKEWTKKEWDKYVNDFSHDPKSPFNVKEKTHE